MSEAIMYFTGLFSPFKVKGPSHSGDSQQGFPPAGLTGEAAARAVHRSGTVGLIQLPDPKAPPAGRRRLHAKRRALHTKRKGAARETAGRCTQDAERYTQSARALHAKRRALHAKRKGAAREA